MSHPHNPLIAFPVWPATICAGVKGLPRRPLGALYAPCRRPGVSNARGLFLG
jgi:hypothetical protein